MLVPVPISTMSMFMPMPTATPTPMATSVCPCESLPYRARPPRDRRVPATAAGALHVAGGNVALRNCTFVGNRAHSVDVPSGGGEAAALGRGGAILATGGVTSVGGSVFIDNNASEGGAVFAAADVFIDSSRLERNVALGRGGALATAAGAYPPRHRHAAAK